jgi:ribonuclease HI
MHHPSSYHISYANDATYWNHNLASVAWAIYTPSDILLHSNGICLGLATNNQAEYDVVIGLLTKASHFHFNHLSVLLYSHLIVLHLNNVYHVHDPCLFLQYLQVILLSRNFDSVIFTHIPRNLNQVADHMANLVLD